jgi:nucleotide-binding universal stress UspA family protein
VAVDGSPAAGRALTQAIAIAQRSLGRLGVLAAIPPTTPCVALPPFSVCLSGLAEELEAAAKRQVDEAVLIVPGDMPVTKLVVRDKLIKAAASEARTGRWDVTVLACGLWLEGGPCWRAVAARLARSCPVPVLVVGRDRDDRPSLKSAEVGALASPYAPQPI